MNYKLTILQINTCLHIGGTGMVTEGIGQEVIRTGWDNYIAYSRNYIFKPPYSTSKLIKIGDKIDLYESVLLNRLFDNEGLSSKRATRKLIRQIESIKPHIIHLHNLHGYYINYPILFGYINRKNIPVVWTLHDCWPFTGHCTHFDGIGCERWRRGCFSCPIKKVYPSSFLFDRSRRNYQRKNEIFNSISNLTLVPVSSWLAGLLGDSFLCEKKIRVIHNGIDIQRFHPIEDDFSDLKCKYGVGNKKVILGVASTWSQRKGLDDFYIISTMLPDTACIVLVGLNEQQLQHLPSNIIGIKKTSNFKDLLSFYSMSHVFCNPTYEDNFPTTNLEALACGTPVITYRTGGSVEAIDSNTGIVVEKGDVKGLYNSIMNILEKPKDNYSQLCRERAVLKWDKNERFKEYIKLYKDILSLK